MGSLDNVESRLDLTDPRVLTGAAPLDTPSIPPDHVSTLPELFQHQARTQPDATAYSCQTENGLRSVTYDEAHAIAASVAVEIAALHPVRNDSNGRAPTVAIWLEKGLDLILSILSTTYSGATWLPFDPDVPVDRAATCVLDACATLLLYDDAHRDRVRELQERIAPTLREAGRSPPQVRIFSELQSVAAATSHPTHQHQHQTHKRLPGPHPRDAAYLIYTSGTTGTPKGIAIPHSAALIFALSEQRVLETSADDIVWNGFSPAFDMFVEEMWVTVAGGGHLAIGTREECRDVPGLPSVWQSRGVSIVNAVPTLIGIMEISQMDGDSALLPPSVRLINLGGEACPPSLVRRIARPGLRIVNTYGPTETTVTATWDELEPDVPVTIGRPLPSYHACLLPISDDGNPTPAEPLELVEGVEGELAIGGPCVGLGYVGREELTAQKFIKHPLAPSSGERLYRTGDRVKLQADLKIAFLGRIDTQVKHRGFRIELGEIESLISNHADVQTAAVILANAGSDSARLEAYVVLRQGAAQDTVAIKQLLSEHLPSYMRPEEVYFIASNDMPRLPSGKINAKALHELSARKAEELAASKAIYSSDCLSEATTAVGDATPLGILLLNMSLIFPQVGHIKPDADFFDDLGGHSLLAATLVSRLRKASSDDGKDIPFASIGLPDIYEARTPASIAARYTSCDSLASTIVGGDEVPEVDGTGAQTGDIRPVSQAKFVLCGIAQIIPLLLFYFLQSINILVPYLLVEYLNRTVHFGFALLAAYAVFVVSAPAMTMVGIIGKWIIIGKVKEGDYPLYGFYYFRWWTAERFAGLVGAGVVADSPLYCYILRALGAKVGNYCHMGAMGIGSAADLVEIGDDCVIGTDVILAVSVVERGRLILRRIRIGNDAWIGSNSVIEGGAVIEDGGEVAPLTMVPMGMHIPSFQRFHGSPARFERDATPGDAALGRQTRPSGARAVALCVGHFFAAGFLLPLLHLIPQVPGLTMYQAIDFPDLGQWVQVAILALPIAFAYQFSVFFQFILLRYIMIGRLKEGKYKIYSAWYLRKWTVERSMDLALEILHPVFATLYVVPFLKALGVKIGHRAEVSTARSVDFEMIDIGEESFVADAVLLGDKHIRGNEITLMKTKLESRAFAGNASLIPQGTTLASDTLVGVLSIAPPPDKPLKSGTSCFGTPPVRMPNRQPANPFPDSVLFNPSRGRIAARLTIEGLRIIVPRAVIIFGIGFSIQICILGYNSIGVVYTLMMLPFIFIFMFALPALFLTAIMKWTLIGKYKKAEWPLWSLNVWLSEAVTSTYETVARPLLTNVLVGTPYLAWCFRLLGVKIGKRVTMLANDITEYDCVTIGDEVVFNQRCGAQTHLFEDRIMKVGHVSLADRSCLKPYSICLPGSSLSENSQLGSLSLLMKGENLPEGTAWEGAPVVPRKRRRGPPSIWHCLPPKQPYNNSSEGASRSAGSVSWRSASEVDVKH